DRPAPGTDDAGVGDVFRRVDQGRSWDHDLSMPWPDVLGPQRDACVLPPGACFSTQDCPTGWACVGCAPDPCCPWCNHCMGRCQEGCSKNENCNPDQYCHVDGACQVTGAKMGQCRARPKDKYCDTFGPPVCGCDGKIYACAKVAYAAGINLDPDPRSCMTCGDLAKQYTQALGQAKKCSISGPSAQCTHSVDSALACGCPTRVNLASVAVPTLAALKKAWNAKQCGAVIDCPPVVCEVVAGAGCTRALPSASVGTCTDYFTN
ncbi:MAG: hypothetical protein KAI47_00715, partial [Deltaproteobacteria bacterium]|nr:hypothetical protein [Deltaproteobacteria bacterium]